MSKDNIITISLEEYSVGTSMRHFADKLFDLIGSMDVDAVIIDFANTDFVSRSFVQQYLDRKAASDVRTSEKNCVEAVKRMFALVQRNERKDERFDFSTWKTDTLPA